MSRKKQEAMAILQTEGDRMLMSDLRWRLRMSDFRFRLLMVRMVTDGLIVHDDLWVWEAER